MMMSMSMPLLCCQFYAIIATGGHIFHSGCPASALLSAQSPTHTLAAVVWPGQWEWGKEMEIVERKNEDNHLELGKKKRVQTTLSTSRDVVKLLSAAGFTTPHYGRGILVSVSHSPHLRPPSTSYLRCPNKNRASAVSRQRAESVEAPGVKMLQRASRGNYP